MVRSTAYNLSVDGEPNWKVWVTGSVTGRVQKARAGMKGGRGAEGVGGILSMVVRGRDDGLELKGWVKPGGRSIATGLGRKPVGGCYSAEMRRPAIRSTAHDPILSYLSIYHSLVKWEKLFKRGSDREWPLTGRYIYIFRLEVPYMSITVSRINSHSTVCSTAFSG